MTDDTNDRDRRDRPAHERLDEWLAGDLAPGGDAERDLLAADPTLAADLERHRELRRGLGALPTDVAPERDLWPAIAARIAAPAPPLRRRVWQRTIAVPAWAALAALLAVALGTAWLLRSGAAGPVEPPATVAVATAAPLPSVAARPTAPAPSPPEDVASEAAPVEVGTPVDAAPATAPRESRAPSRRRAPSPTERVEVAEASTPAPVLPARRATGPLGPAGPPLGEVVPALAAYAETDRQLAALRVELRLAIEAQQHRLPPETRALVFDNLETIERALAEIEAALLAAPGDGDLARTYIAYRQREIAVLRQANAMAARL